MLAILREISVPCFFTSYVVVLVLELLRLWGRIPGRGLLVVVMTGLGLFTHVCYMIFRAADGAGTEIGQLATWYDWSLLLALGLAVCFFIFYLLLPSPSPLTARLTTFVHHCVHLYRFHHGEASQCPSSRTTHPPTSN